MVVSTQGVGSKRPVKAPFLSNCHCHNSKVSQQESSVFVFLHLVNSNCLTAPLIPPLEQFTLVVLWLFGFILWGPLGLLQMWRWEERRGGRGESGGRGVGERAMHMCVI